jgi:hypothetical protein
VLLTTKKWMILGVLLVSLLFAGTALAQGSIDWWVIGGGGGSGTAGDTSLDGTIGQWAVGGGTSGATQLGSGFWGGGGAEGPVGGIFLPVLLRQYP